MEKSASYKNRNKVLAAVESRAKFTKDIKQYSKKYKNEKKEYKKLKKASKKAKIVYKKDRSSANSRKYNQSKEDLKKQRFKLT